MLKVYKPLFTLAVVIYIVYTLVTQQIQMYKYKKDIVSNNQKIEQQKKITEDLTRTKETYQSDEYIEKMAREKLGYVKPGEKVYIDKVQQ